MIDYSQGLKVTNLSFSIDDTDILNNISFGLNAGETLALLGTNGSGKTTLLNCITGYYPINSGNISWKNTNINNYAKQELCNIVTHCSEAPTPFYSCNVAEMILFGRSAKAGFWGSYSKQDYKLVENFANFFELTNLLDRGYTDLSLGERQRVNLAMSLVAEPEFLLLDEPSSHLDPYFQKKLLNCIISHAIQDKMGIIAVLHDINKAIHFDRVIVLHQGQIALNGSPKEILTDVNLNYIFGKDVFKTYNNGNEKINILNL